MKLVIFFIRLLVFYLALVTGLPHHHGGWGGGSFGGGWGGHHTGGGGSVSTGSEFPEFVSLNFYSRNVCFFIKIIFYFSLMCHHKLLLTQAELRTEGDFDYPKHYLILIS